MKLSSAVLRRKLSIYLLSMWLITTISRNWRHLRFSEHEHQSLSYLTHRLTDAHFTYKATQEIKNNAWVTVNNDFLATSGVICQWFSRVTKSRVKIIGKTPHEWPKIVIHGNECIILFLTRYFISWTYRSATNNHRSPISPLSPGTVFSDLTLWRHHSWSVTSREREALALWRNIHRLF